MAYKGKFVPKNTKKYIGENYNKITYRSLWELKFCQMCDEHPNILFWASESISIKYKHPFTKQTKSYIPDFFVVYVDSKGRKFVELVEIKPMNQTDPKYAKTAKDKECLIINQAKWAAARAYCKKYNITFRIICEQHIFRNTKYNSKVKPGRRKK